MYYFGKPFNSPKFHIFLDSMSLCQKWGFFPLQDGDDKISDMIAMKPTRGDCADCIRRFNRACPKPKGSAA